MKVLKSGIILLLTVLLTSISYAQLGEEATPKKKVSPPDPRISKALDRLGIKYEMSESGNFKITMKVDDNGRTQLVTIINEPETYESMEIREVQGIAFSSKFKSDYSSSMLFDILEDNHQKKLGNWQINGGEPPFLLLFSVRISANSSDKILSEVIDLVASVADKKEVILTKGKDDF